MSWPSTCVTALPSLRLTLSARGGRLKRNDSCAVYCRRATIDSVRVQKVDDLRSGLAIGSVRVLSVLLLMFAHAMSGMQT